MPQIIFSMSRVGKTWDRKPVLRDISLSFFHGAKIGVVGENGAGKSTLLRIMAGEDTDHDGEVVRDSGVSVLLVPQEPRLDPSRDVRGNLEAAVRPVKELVLRFEEVAARLGEDPPGDEMERLMAEMDGLQVRIDAVDGWEIDRRLDLASEALVLPPDDADVTTLSGGERRRVALCRALLQRPDVLLLDEPTNHLDAVTVAWLERALRDYPGTVIIVTHDRYFLDGVTRWILELDRGRGLPYEGNYSSWLEQKAERLRIEEQRETDRQRVLRRELEWIRSGQRGRQKKGAARVARYGEIASRTFEARTDDVCIQIPPGPRLGDRVLAFEGVRKGTRGQTLLDRVDFDLPGGAVVGLVGPNGAGKTTLFRMVVGEEKPDAGTIRIGPSVVLSYVDQERDALDDGKTVWEEISGGKEEIELAGRRVGSRAYVARFNFRGPDQQKRVGLLSGGERNRVHLAKLLRTGGNLLLLDEPTNDLDVATLRVLEQALIEFPACAMVISHDRMFLDRICTHLLVFEGDGRVRWFEGNFSAYEEQVLAKEEPDGRRGRFRRLPRR